MSDPLPLGKKALHSCQFMAKQASNKIKTNGVVFAALMLLIFGSMVRFLTSQQPLEAQAFTATKSSQDTVQSPLFEKSGLFDQFDSENGLNTSSNQEFQKKHIDDQVDESRDELAQRIYSIVGETPIRQMVPYISQRDDKVAAFLVAIAKKESSFGLASPSKDGKDCYNYWGFKGQGGQGESMGYACFASSEEAIEKVGNRIQKLVEKDVTTPERMVDIWKCGSSCKGDPGAPSWISTVALYYTKITS